MRMIKGDYRGGDGYRISSVVFDLTDASLNYAKAFAFYSRRTICSVVRAAVVEV